MNLFFVELAIKGDVYAAPIPSRLPLLPKSFYTEDACHIVMDNIFTVGKALQHIHFWMW